MLFSMFLPFLSAQRSPKAEKKEQNLWEIKKEAYLCTALREKPFPLYEEESFWRGGRVVDCGGLENR